MIAIPLLLVAASALQQPAVHTAAVALVLPNGPSYSDGESVAGGVEIRRDGYVMVLRTDGDGRVTVLFPQRPADPQTVHAGTFYRLGARDGFPELVAGADERIVVAWSPNPFAIADIAASTFWSADSLRHWKSEPEALARHAAGAAAVQLILTTLSTYPPALGSAGYRLARRGSGGTLAERHPLYVPHWVRDAAPRSGVPPPVCGGGVCRYSAMRLADLTPF